MRTPSGDPTDFDFKLVTWLRDRVSGCRFQQVRKPIQKIVRVDHSVRKTDGIALSPTERDARLQAILLRVARYPAFFGHSSGRSKTVTPCLVRGLTNGDHRQPAEDRCAWLPAKLQLHQRRCDQWPPSGILSGNADLVTPRTSAIATANMIDGERTASRPPPRTSDRSGSTRPVVWRNQR